MLQYRRADRVANEILHSIAGTVRTELDDPRLEGVSITRVDLSDDLRHARVFFSIIGEAGERKSAAKGLENAMGRFKRGIKRLKLRFVPELVFIYDRGLEHSQRISDLLDEISEGSEGHEHEQEDD